MTNGAGVEERHVVVIREAGAGIGLVFGDPSLSYTPLIGFGVMLSTGYRRLRQLEATRG
jgi:hypothetical protein